MDSANDMAMVAILVLAGLWAGAQNALAGGGSFVTLPALMLTGVDPRAANITSTVAVFPGQVTTAIANLRLVSGVGRVGFALLFAISAIGGALGALLLLATPSDLFARLLPWLVLVATGLFARGAFGPRLKAGQLPAGRLKAAQLGVAIYGGYFGGGIGFLMLALYTLAGTGLREAQANKNALAAVMNAAGALVFAFSGDVAWGRALVLGSATMAGGYVGALMIRRVPERAMKLAVVALGLALSFGLFWREFA